MREENEEGDCQSSSRQGIDSWKNYQRDIHSLDSPYPPRQYLVIWDGQ